MESTLDALLVDAAAEWSRSSFSRFNDSENCCTIRLVACIQDHILRRDEYALISAHPEAANPTADMLAGLADVQHMTRPDIRVHVGQRHCWTIECKRLDNRDSRLQVKYVDDGIARFRSGGYPSQGDHCFMVGYVSGGNVPLVVSNVNRTVERRFGISEQLTNPSQRTSTLLTSSSRHAGTVAVTLKHYLLDLN